MSSNQLSISIQNRHLFCKSLSVFQINTEEAEEEDETTRATERETTEAEEETSETMTKKEEEDDDEDDDDDMEDGGEETATEVRNRTIIYKNEEFRQLCEDPVFTAIDVDIDGTEVMIFKGDKFYVMESESQNVF